MGFLGQALQGGNTVNTTPYQAQTGLNGEAQSALTNQQGVSQQQQNFLTALTGNAQNASQGLNQLGGQLQQEASGQGPNPALNQLNQATNQNMSNTAAQIASAKGINPGLAARLAAQSGAQTQQQAAGQAATMGAQQQLAAQNALSSLYGNQIGQAQNQAGIVGQQGLTQQQILQQATQGQNAQNVAGQNANVTSANAIGSGVLGLIDPAISMLGGSSGGGGGGGGAGGLGALAALAHGGQVPALLSPGEQYFSPDQAQKVADGKASPMSGKMVPGKAKVKGDSPKNDTFRTHLEPGGVVVPRSQMNSEDPSGNAQKFVQAILNSKGSFGKVVAAKKKMQGK
jgi:hypothetical protein